MQDFFIIFIGIIIPFIGTSLGSAVVFFMKNNISKNTEKLLLGFASGLMFAASIWSLIIPSIEFSRENGNIAWFPATMGIVIGGLFLMFMDKIFPILEPKFQVSTSSKFKETIMLIFAIIIHNFPEGMAVGVGFAGALSGDSMITVSSAFALAIGIAIQNIPEGAAISMPLLTENISKNKAFFWGILSGVIEPIAAFITIILSKYLTPLLPYLLAFAAGAMIYVVIEELIPKIHDEENKFGTIGCFIGFILMMMLDVIF